MLILVAIKKIRYSRVFLIGAASTVFFASLLGLRAWGLYFLLEEQELIEAKLVVINRNSRSAYHLDKDLAAVESMAKDIESRLINASREAYNLRIFYALEKLTQVTMQDASQVHVALFAIPEAEDDEDLLDEGVDVDIEDREDLDEEEAQVYQVMTFSMRLEGSFNQLTDFLYKLRTGGPFTRLAALDIWVPEEPKRPGVLQAELTVEVLGEEGE